MKDFLVLSAFAVIIYVLYRKFTQQPILPWKDKKQPLDSQKVHTKKSKQKRHEITMDQEPNVFRELFNDIQEISNHMVRFKDNTFILIAEIEPVNYFLKSQMEQEAIDITFETWLGQISYPVKFYLQNRYIDLTEPIEQIQKSMESADDLNEAALSFGKANLEDLHNWQKSSPRFETKRYLVFTHKMKISEITGDSKEEIDNKLVDKAFAELYRRLNTAKSQLRKAEISVKLLPTEGIYDLLYHAFNRRRATKNRFKDFASKELTALYATAEQDSERIEAVRERIENEDISKEEKQSN